jgi:ABC-type phosphate transport system substrate-binding protein
LHGLPADAAAQSSALRGKVVADGSSTVFPVTEATAASFRDHYLNVNVTVGISGTGGFKRFVKGDPDIQTRPGRSSLKNSRLPRQTAFNSSS